MKSFVALSALVVVLFACTTLGVPGGRVGAASNVWKLSVTGSSGSGFPVSCEQAEDGSWVVLFLTAKHVVELVDTNWSANLDGRVHLSGGTVLTNHSTRDASLVLFLSPKRIEPVMLNKRDAVFGEEVWAAGYPASIHLVITQGLVGRPNHASANVYLGNSGGAVIDSSGRVIGIVVAMLVDWPEGSRIFVDHVMYFVPVTAIAEWLRYWGINS